MAELRLVNKDALLAEWDKQSPRGHYEFDQTIMEFPTTTEAEIRAKAIDEFAEKLKAELSEQIFSDEEKFKYARKEQEAICAQNATWKMAIRLVNYVAEQLKEE